MAWLLLNRDTLSKEETWGEFDSEGKLLRLRVDMPTTAVEQIKYLNEQARNGTDGKRFGEWNRFASVPAAFVNAWGVDTAVDMGDSKYLSKVFNDSDYGAFRTSRGKV